jgi:hypothetical protein
MIQKQINTPNGPAAFHVLKKVESLDPFDMLILTVDSYASEAVYQARGGFMMRHTIPMPSPRTAGDLVDDIDAWLIADAGSPFQGGQLIADMSGTIESLRERKTSEINAAWIRADSTAFTYAGEHFRAGPDDVLRLNSINGYISLMNEMPPDWIGVWKTMGVGGQPDSYIRVPDVESWKPFYTAFVMKGVTNYLAAQVLKARLATATTAAEIAAITWPE